MPVAGLVVTLDPTPALRSVAFEALSSMQGISVGENQGDHLPLVTDCASVNEQQGLWDAVARTPGVVSVALAFLDFSDVEDFEMPVRRRDERAPRAPEVDDGSA